LIQRHATSVRGAVQAGSPSTCNRACDRQAPDPDGLVVDVQVLVHSLVGITDRLIHVEVDLLAVKAPSQPFDERVVAAALGHEAS
jgi:hypothetical protein